MARIGLHFFLAVICYCGSPTNASPSTIGREFIFSIPSDYVYKRGTSQRLFLSSQTGETVTANIITSGSNFQHTVKVSGDQEVILNLPSSLTSRGTGLKRNAIGIRADGDISVHVHMEAGVNSGAFTPLPTNSLGRDYIIGVYEPLRPRYSSGFTVTATEAGAIFQIRFSRDVAYGHVLFGPDRMFKFQLEPFESFQVMSEEDLTGTRVMSDQPIAVVTGSECSRVPVGVKYCDYLVEQMPPIHTLGKQFIVAPFRDRETSYVLRVMAPFNNTTIRFVSSYLKDVQLQENDFYELIFNRHIELAFKSSKPVLVLQYMKGFQSGDFVGDPSMVVVPPIEQFITGELSFVSMDDDHVTLVVTNTNMTLSELSVNGESIGHGSGGWSVLVDEETTAIVHGTLESGRHTLSHADPEASLLVLGYGTGYLSGRAFPVAYNLKRLYVPSHEPLFITPRGYDVRCLNTSMAITLDTSVFLIHKIDDVTLNDPTCKHVVVNDNIVVLTTDFASCGTHVQENENSVTFSNTLWFSESVITPFLPSRDLSFNCVIEQQAGFLGVSSLTGGNLTAHSVLSDEVLGDLTLSLVQFVDDTFALDATRNASTDPWREFMEGAQGQNIFAVNVTSSVDASIFVDSCWTTPSPDFDDPSSSEIIQDGCEIDDTIRIGASADDPRFRPIAVNSFSPIGEYNEVFMHCRVQVCRGEDSAAHCWQECRREPRSKRAMGGRAVEMYTVSTGPIRTK